jgi:ubiquinol-cytochrome c reductase iron-sulfur subunit
VVDVQDRQQESPNDFRTGRPVNQRAYRAAIVSFVIAVAGGITAAVAYARDETDLWLGIGLAAALGGIGFGLVAWAKFLDLDEHAVQQRERLTMTPDDVRGLEEELELTRETVGRRKLLVGLLGVSFISMIVGFVGPIGSLGPKPRGERSRTSWRPGSRLVTSEGRPIESATGTFDQLVTVFPEGAIGVDDSQVVLLRLPPDLLTERTIERGAVDGWVAYSKICTHAGCSVGLFGVDNRPPQTLRQLVCPCHQSVFDPSDSARPVGGPAPRPLPQLAIEVDDEGFLVAQGDFRDVVGPLAWNEADEFES